MSDRVALVAGAGGPLGRSVAVKLVGAGFTVAEARPHADGSVNCPPDGHGASAQVPGDATDPAAAKAVVDRVAAEVGPPECAGEHHRHVRHRGRAVGDAPTSCGR